jgi:hypothetical protein
LFPTSRVTPKTVVNDQPTSKVSNEWEGGLDM